MPAIDTRSMYSTRSGPTPLATMGGTARAISSTVANGASSVVWCSGRGWSLKVASVTRASVPSDPTISWVRS